MAGTTRKAVVVVDVSAEDVEEVPVFVPVSARAPVSVPVLARASESGDPAVHQLLAHRGIAELNNDVAAMVAVDKALADLGFC